MHASLPLGLPLQVHTGYGDPDLTLHRADPSLLTPFLRALPAEAGPVVLLHCYPYHRQAAYLANVFPQVMVDVSLAVNHVGPRAAAVLAETLELAPFGSLLYASDGFALAELHHLGAVLFRRALGAGARRVGGRRRDERRRRRPVRPDGRGRQRATDLPASTRTRAMRALDKHPGQDHDGVTGRGHGPACTHDAEWRHGEHRDGAPRGRVRAASGGRAARAGPASRSAGAQAQAEPAPAGQ